MCATRENIIANVNEDVARLLEMDAAEEGRKLLYDRYFANPEWCRWRYSDTKPESAEEYALDRPNGTIRVELLPPYVTQRAAFEYFRDLVELDFERLTEDD